MAEEPMNETTLAIRLAHLGEKLTKRLDRASVLAETARRIVDKYRTVAINEPIPESVQSLEAAPQSLAGNSRGKKPLDELERNVHELLRTTLDRAEEANTINAICKELVRRTLRDPAGKLWPDGY